MPELPEVEHIRRMLEPLLVSASVTSARMLRRDVVRAGGGSRTSRIAPRDLLVNSSITRLHRHGKNLAIIADTGRVICVHLGMSGQLRWLPANAEAPKLGHVHVIWNVSTNESKGRLIFRDPRRFGGVWLFDSMTQLANARLNSLGPDALAIDGSTLATRIRGSARSIKAALLDQSVVAGVGNIYADEALFRAGVNPAKSARTLTASHLDALAAAVVDVLNAAIASGGSTIRSYVDSTGQGGAFAASHMVYGRGGQPCRRCDITLRHTTISQRTTTFCPQCQPRKLRSIGPKQSTHSATYPQFNNTKSVSRRKVSRAATSTGATVGLQAQRRRRVVVSSSPS